MITDNEPITVMGGRVQLQQIEGGFKTSIDAVLLAAACPAEQRETVLDMGCGIGSAGLCLLARQGGLRLTGFDIQVDHIDIAKKNAALNNMQNRCDFLVADIRSFEGQTYDHILFNPPYLTEGCGLESPSEKRATALGHHETALQDWVACAFDHIKGQGSLTMVHRADQADKIIQAFGARFGALNIIPLWPKQGQNAKRVILRAFKHKKTGCSLRPGLVLHNDDGSYTNKANKILKDGQGLY